MDIFVFDFDNTFVFGPTVEEGKEKLLKLGYLPSYTSWFKRKESLDTSLFEFKINKDLLEVYKKPGLKILSTNRVKKMEDEVKNLLSKFDVSFDYYSFDEDPKYPYHLDKGNKGDRLLRIIKDLNVNCLYFYDDDINNLHEVNDKLQALNVSYELYLVNKESKELKYGRDRISQ